MAAGGFKTFVAGEVLDEDDINDYLMQGVLVFAGSAARGSAIVTPVEGQVSFLQDKAVNPLEYYDGTNWVEVKTGLSWAPIGSVSGTYTQGTVVDGDVTWQYYKFTGAGTVTFAEDGFVDLLVVGGGGNGGQTTQGGFSSTGGGGGGAVRWGIHEVTAGSHAVTVGTGGAAALNAINTGGTSSFGTVLKAGGGRAPRLSDLDPVDRYAPLGGGGSDGGVTSFEATVTGMPGAGQGGTVYGSNNYDGITLNYDGVSREYGTGGRLSVDAVANTGGGGREGVYAGADGVVIVRVQI